jgi:two-component system OmpR family sensor kinase
MRSKLRFHTLRARLTLWYVGLLSIMLLILGGCSYGLLLYSQAHDIDVALQGMARRLEKQAIEQSRFFPSDVESLFRRFFGLTPWGHYYEMRGPRGQRDPRLSLQNTGRLPFSELARRNAQAGRYTFETLRDLGDYPVRVLTRPVIDQGRLINVVQVGMSLESLYTTRRHFLLIMAAVFPFALLFAGIGGWMLAKRALAPVHQMTQAATRIRAEHLGERLRESGIGDELDRLAKTLNGMLERLDDAFRQIRQFSADASHELQTPLTILKGELEVALRAPRGVHDYQVHLQSALEEVDRIADLVDGLLLLSRADAGVLRMDQKPVDLAQVALEVFEQTQILAAAQKVRLEIGKMEPCVIAGDRDRLQRLLLNLVDNAIKYTPSGGSVEISLSNDRQACLKVSDSGIGIPQEEQEQIFNRFHRSAEARAMGKGGSGLGLCIARSIAQAHGGHIEVASAPGQGSAFTVCLPTRTSQVD